MRTRACTSIARGARHSLLGQAGGKRTQRKMVEGNSTNLAPSAAARQSRMVYPDDCHMRHRQHLGSVGGAWTFMATCACLLATLDNARILSATLLRSCRIRKQCGRRITNGQTLTARLDPG